MTKRTIISSTILMDPEQFLLRYSACIWQAIYEPLSLAVTFTQHARSGQVSVSDLSLSSDERMRLLKLVLWLEICILSGSEVKEI